ncbi:MAG: hypothetical protein V4707_03195 [Pseudomonadota bacterium]
MTRPILFVLTLAALGLATPALAQDAMNDPCRSDDLVCRVDRLERTVEQLVDRLAESGQSPAAAPRSVDVPVQYSCSGQGCASVAAQTCRTAGFPRGVPAAFSPDSGFLIRITCMD